MSKGGWAELGADGNSFSKQPVENLGENTF